MVRGWAAGLALLALAACRGGAPPRGDEALNDLFDRYLRERADLDPVWATYAGLHDFDARLTRWDDASLDARKVLARATLNDLHALDASTLSPDAAVDFAMWEQDLLVELYDYAREDPRAKWPSLPLDAVSVVNTMLLKDYAPRERRARDAVARLREIPLVVDDAMKFVQRPPKLWTEMAIEDLGSVSGFFDELPALAGGSSAELAEAISVARDALERYVTFLKETVLPRSDGAYIVGRAAYDFYLKHRHALDMDAEALLAVGRREFDRTVEMMDACAASIDPEKSARDLLEEIKRNVPKAAELRQVYERETARAREFLIDHAIVGIPDGEKLEIIDTPEFERSTTPYAAYSRPAPLDSARTGHFYVTPVPADATPEDEAAILSGHNLHDMPGTVWHEAYPGHHLQFVYAKGIGSRVRRLVDSPTLSEGWGLYCEELAHETGYYASPRDRLMQLNWRLQRAARVILDVGVHSGAISYEEAVKFLMEKVQMERPQAEASVKAYTQRPTYFMSYLVGCLEIQKLRERLKAKLGPRFTLKEFHERFLRYGNVHPGLIARAMERDWT